MAELQNDKPTSGYDDPSELTAGSGIGDASGGYDDPEGLISTEEVTETGYVGASGYGMYDDAEGFTETPQATASSAPTPSGGASSAATSSSSKTEEADSAKEETKPLGFNELYQRLQDRPGNTAEQRLEKAVAIRALTRQFELEARRCVVRYPS